MAEVLADIGGGRVLPGLGRIALVKLSPTDVQAFLNARLVSGLTPRRVQMLTPRRVQMLTPRRVQIVPSGPAAGAPDRGDVGHGDPQRRQGGRCPRVIRHEISLLSAELARLLFDSAAGDRHLGLYVTALMTGLRQGELLGLRWAVELPERPRSALRAHRTRQLIERLVAGSRWVDGDWVFAATIGTAPCGRDHPGVPGGARACRVAEVDVP